MPGEIRRQHSVSCVNGRIVRTFAFAERGGTTEPIAQLWGAHTKITSFFPIAQQQFITIDASKDFTATGRLAAKRAWARTNAGALKEAVAAMNQAENFIAGLRAKMVGPLLDKNDVVGYMRQAELRAFLRSLSDAKRNELLAETPTQPVDAEIAAAVSSAPAMLSGATSAQRERLLERGMAVKFPAEIEQIENISAASEALADVVGVAAATLRKSGGLTSDDINELVGAPTFAERLGTIIAADQAA